MAIRINAPDIKALVDAEKAAQAMKDLRAQNTLYKKNIVDLWDTLGSIKEELEKLPALRVKTPSPLKNTKTKATVILPLYDLHIGQLFSTEDNSYGSPDEFIERCNKLSEQLVGELKNLRLSKNLEKLVIIFGGDIVDGRTIYKGQAKDSAPIQYQLTVGPEVISRNLLAPLAALFPQVEVFCVPGNHGRVGEKNELEKVEDNLDMIFTHICRLRCSSIKNIKWNDTDKFYGYFTLYDKKYLVVHGDGFKSWNGVPIYGANKYKERMQNTLNNQIDVMIVGHHHNQAEWNLGFSKICMMGSWVGTTDFGLSLGLGGPATQKVIVADETNPTYMTYEFMLSEKDVHHKAKPVKL